ncbi:MAG: FAD-dependent thymidylate synthase [Flavonifractor plautii]
MRCGTNVLWMRTMPICWQAMWKEFDQGNRLNPALILPTLLPPILTFLSLTEGWPDAPATSPRPRSSEGSAEKFVQNILKRGHEAVIEHGSVTVRFTCDRGVSHEIVRHRLASYCQESTRYCNYGKEQFGTEITFIAPAWTSEGYLPYTLWKKC